LLLAMWNPATPEEVAVACQAPLFRVRSAIREFVQAKLIEEDSGAYLISSKGMKKMEG
jgi:hypothetical protein